MTVNKKGKIVHFQQKLYCILINYWMHLCHSKNLNQKEFQNTFLNVLTDLLIDKTIIMKRKLHYLFLSFALLAFAGCKETTLPAEQQSISTIEITQTNVTLENKYTASIRGKSDIAVYPQISGYITNVCVEEGSIVKEGQTLFIIDQVPYQSALETAEANVRIAESKVNTAKLLFESKQELFQNNVVSAFELSTAENDYVSAQAQLKLTQAQENIARNNLYYTVVKSPSEGIIGTLPYKKGSLVGPSLPQPLTTVSDNTLMYAYFSMTENKLLALLREHNTIEEAINAIPPVTLELSDGTLYKEKGRVETVSGIIEPKTGSVSFKAAFPNNGRLLHSGGSGNVIISSPRDHAIVIPKSATFEI